MINGLESSGTNYIGNSSNEKQEEFQFNRGNMARAIGS
jgi:hypothetical protein